MTWQQDPQSNGFRQSWGSGTMEISDRGRYSGPLLSIYTGLRLSV